MMLIKCCVLTDNKHIVLSQLKGKPHDLRYHTYKEITVPLKERVEEPHMYLPLNDWCNIMKSVNGIDEGMKEMVKNKIKLMFPPGRIWIHKRSRSLFRQ